MNPQLALNIVVPMAGRGSRFADVGFLDPKPMIPVGGRPMIEWVIDNIRPARPHRFIFLCLGEHLEKYPQVRQKLQTICRGCAIISVDQVTEGAACTVLLAKELVDSAAPLMIANSDQIVDLNVDDYLDACDEAKADGIIMTFWADHPKWSYCRVDPEGLVTDVVEKKVVSNHATVGIYNFSRGSDFIRAADRMIERNLRVNGEFYVAPAYNHLIEEGKKVVIIGTGKEGGGMYGMGTPMDLDLFKQTDYYLKRI
jgi:dTDP-glucose pyrophosphorylase